MRNPAPIAVALAAAVSLATLAGCESLIPRSDLQAVARALPPSPEVTPEQRQQMAAQIRQRTGVATFEFSDSEFTPETRLPSGTEWILGLFLGGQGAP